MLKSFGNSETHKVRDLSKTSSYELTSMSDQSTNQTNLKVKAY